MQAQLDKGNITNSFEVISSLYLLVIIKMKGHGPGTYLRYIESYFRYVCVVGRMLSFKNTSLGFSF